MSEPDFDSAITKVLQRDPRYARAAYTFAFFALEFTLREHLKLKEEHRRHVSARELLEGMCAAAIDQFGAMAESVWESWGIHTTTDWGNIVFNLISVDLMKQNDEDKFEDFKDVFSLEEAFKRAWQFYDQAKKDTK